MVFMVPIPANNVQRCLRRFRSGLLDVKHAPCIGRPVVGNIDEITEIIKVERQSGIIPS